MLEHGLRMRIDAGLSAGRPVDRADGYWAVADEMKEPARVEIICQMQKVELLSNDPTIRASADPRHRLGTPRSSSS
jgi:hypothetical protein